MQQHPWHIMMGPCRALIKRWMVAVPMARTIWRATSGNGFRTGMTADTTPRVPRRILKVRKAVAGAFFAAARGTLVPSSCGPPTVSGTIRRARTSTSGFGVFVPESLSSGFWLWSFVGSWGGAQSVGLSYSSPTPARAPQPTNCRRRVSSGGRIGEQRAEGHGAGAVWPVPRVTNYS